MTTRPQGYHLSYNAEEKAKILLLHSQGVSIRKIAGMMGLSRSVVGRAVKPAIRVPHPQQEATDETQKN